MLKSLWAAIHTPLTGNSCQGPLLLLTMSPLPSDSLCIRGKLHGLTLRQYIALPLIPSCHISCIILLLGTYALLTLHSSVSPCSLLLCCSLCLAHASWARTPQNCHLCLQSISQNLLLSKAFLHGPALPPQVVKAKISYLKISVTLSTHTHTPTRPDIISLAACYISGM